MTLATHDAATREAAQLVERAWLMGNGTFVRPRAVDGWVFAILPNGFPFGLRVRPARRPSV